VIKLTCSALFLVLLLTTDALAGDLAGKVSDRAGGALSGASVRLLNIASGDEVTTKSDTNGQYRFASLGVGIYRVVAGSVGFSDASRTVVIESDTKLVTIDFILELGAVRAEVTVSADRGERDVETVPLRVDSLESDMMRTLTPTSTGEAMAVAPGVTIVGSGPFQIRPRLRGLDSTRVLVLVDGERLNNARTATDRAGAEVGLIDVDSVQRIEVLGGAGSVLYGTDALSGTINIITNQPVLTDTRLFSAGFNGFYSSNENGARGTVSLGVSSSKFAISFLGGGETYDDYRAGKPFNESSQPYHDDGTLHQVDTIDDNFGFNLGKFPEPFNAPFTRTSATIPNSAMEGNSVSLAGLVKLAGRQTLEVNYRRRRTTNVGFPDFAEPAFFQGIALPFSNLDKFSATYSATNLKPWFTRLSATSYYQRQDRLLRNDVPVQFPAPAATFFPISVYRLDILSDTRQQVWTPGVDIQATFLAHSNNVLTAGVTALRDRSEDARSSSTQMSLLGQVNGTFGPFGPVPTTTVVNNPPIPTGPPTLSNPTRVPDASFRDTGLFVHDEWTPSRAMRVTLGLRMDRYGVTTDPTPGYEIASLVQGAVPPIDPATLPDVNGEHIARNAFTGEAGVVLHADAAVSPFAHYTRSYRHPNLEELLFSGPATVGSIVPNITVKPETGHNVDAGVRVRLSRVVGSVAYFNNTYNDFISTEIVAQKKTQSGTAPISQAINLAKVRIQGVETEATVPLSGLGLLWVPNANVNYNRGTVLSGTTPLTGESLAGQPQDNITPWKVAAGLRVSDGQERWWGSYGLRSQAEVTRVSPLLSDSEFLIAQDLFGLAGFTVHRIAGGYDWNRNNERLGITVAVDNLTDVFYREQFQFAPARGRTVTVLVHVGGSR
jgi:outer membrane receptor protein involved in Fe transport